MKITSFQERVQDLLAQIHALEQDEKLKKERKLPSECYFLSADTVLSYRRGDGDARYPYAHDGMTLWAYTSGNMKMEESVYNVFLPAYEGKEPNIGFFAGIACDEQFFPVSLLGTARQAFEKDIKAGNIPDVVLACGPTPMLKALIAVTKRENLTCYVSLEERMGCGIGACVVCVCELTNGKKARVCKDGPVFNANELSF